jgi:hypothetical protein
MRMLRKKEDNDLLVCVNFCHYYKPGRNEELACQGFVVVRRLINACKRLPRERPPVASVPDAGTIEGLKDRLCPACPFSEADCDFVLSGGRASPCGGFALLSHLLGSGELKLEEIG